MRHPTNNPSAHLRFVGYYEDSVTANDMSSCQESIPTLRNNKNNDNNKTVCFNQAEQGQKVRSQLLHPRWISLRNETSREVCLVNLTRQAFAAVLQELGNGNQKILPNNQTRVVDTF